MEPRYALKVRQLLEKGVDIPSPRTVEISEDVNLDRISGDNVSIYSGCKIYGSSTLISKGSQLGYEGPVTVENCQIGPQVELKGGFCKESVFLNRACLGFGSHVRAGTILEEEARIAHAVALKQTILFPYVTLGSLVNFCDCFMSGGTGRKNHSEVGSSYIHFNYTPNQDKATPSLIGDVPRGVMLNQRPIFLGGQGGLVGPCRFEFGTVTAAGSICRKDELKPGRLVIAQRGKEARVRFVPGKYWNLKRTVINNIIYISNLMALMNWYVNVRSQFLSEEFSELLFYGLIEKLDMAIDERLKRFGSLCLKNMNQKLSAKWSEIKELFSDLRYYEGNKKTKEICLESISRGIKRSGKNYLLVIKNLEPSGTESGTKWLQGIVDHLTSEILTIIPSFSPGKDSEQE